MVLLMVGKGASFVKRKIYVLHLAMCYGLKRKIPKLSNSRKVIFGEDLAAGNRRGTSLPLSSSHQLQLQNPGFGPNFLDPNLSIVGQSK